MSEACLNTDKTIWRRDPDDAYSPSIHVTEDGGIGINVGGRVFVRSAEQWHDMVTIIERLRAELAEAVEALKPFAQAHKDLYRALVYPNFVWKLPTTDDYETAQAIVEKHK